MAKTREEAEAAGIALAARLNAIPLLTAGEIDADDEGEILGFYLGWEPRFGDPHPLIYDIQRGTWTGYEGQEIALAADLNAIPLVTLGPDDDRVTFTGHAEGHVQGEMEGEHRFHFHVTYDVPKNAWRFDGVGDWEQEMRVV